MRVNPPLTTLNQLSLTSALNFLSENLHNLHLSFSRAGQQGEICITNQRDLLPNQLTPVILLSPYPPLIPRQVKIHIAPRHSALTLTSVVMFTLCYAKYFSMYSPCSSFYISATLSGNTTPLRQLQNL